MKELKAKIVWTDIGVIVRNIEGFDIPGGTAVDITMPVPLERKPAGTVEETIVLISEYSCTDCGFKTDSVDIMTQHQRSAHTLVARIKSWFSRLRAKSNGKGGDGEQ